MNYNNYSKIKSYDLEQGKKYRNMKLISSSIVSKKQLDLIQETTSSNLGSFYEGMTNQHINTKNNIMTQKMMNLQNEFNTTLQQYTDAYKTYLTQLQNNDSVENKVSGTNVRDNDGSYYYVNKYGFARKYSDEAWKNRHSSCPSNTPTSDTIKTFYQLQRGADMGVGQPCNLEGNVITNNANRRSDWVSPDGYKHWYPNGNIVATTQKNGSCPERSKWIGVSDTEYLAIPSGTNMNNSSKCETFQQNTALWNHILQLNEKLISLAQQLYNEAMEIDKNSDVVNDKMESTKQELMKYVNELQNERNNMVTLQNETETLDGKYKDLQVSIKSNYMHYIAWTVGAVTLSAVAFHHITK